MIQHLCNNADVRYDIGLGVFRRMDVIVCCVDGIDARMAINRACYMVNKPWVDGAMVGMFGIARVFWPGRGPCYECTMYDEDYELRSDRFSCLGFAIQAHAEGKIPTTPTMASILGAIQAQEIIKILHELSGHDFKHKSISGRAFVFDGLNYSAGWNMYSENQNCLAHISYDTIIELPDISTRKSTLADLIDAISKLIMDEFFIELDFRIIKELYCGICNKSELINVPDFKLSHEKSICCNEVRRIVKESFQLARGDELNQTLLYDLGIPPLHIIKVKTQNSIKYFEITGDLDLISYY